jgi:DNA-binding NarL/FixJ family response regulator
MEDAPFEAAAAAGALLPWEAAIAEALTYLAGMAAPAEPHGGQAAPALRATAQSAAVRAPSLPHGLTTREAEVLRLLAGGLSNQEIATALVLSVRTVERHIEAIYGKTGIHGRTARAAATDFAHRHGLTPG